MFVRAAGFGRLKPAMQGEMRAVAGALPRAVVTTGGKAQSELRAQARSAGFKDGGRSIANAWRLNLYPAGGVASTTFKPVAPVWSRMPTVVDAFVGGTALNVSFTFICTTTFEGAPGQLRWQDNGAVRLIQGNVNADTTADLTIFVKAAGPVVGNWFVL